MSKRAARLTTARSAQAPVAKRQPCRWAQPVPLERPAPAPVSQRRKRSYAARGNAGRPLVIAESRSIAAVAPTPKIALVESANSKRLVNAQARVASIRTAPAPNPLIVGLVTQATSAPNLSGKAAFALPSGSPGLATRRRSPIRTVPVGPCAKALSQAAKNHTRTAGLCLPPTARNARPARVSQLGAGSAAPGSRHEGRGWCPRCRAGTSCGALV